MAYSHHSSGFSCNMVLGLWIPLQVVIAYAVVLQTDYRELSQANHTPFASSNDIELHCSNDNSWIDSRPFFDPRECFGSIYFMRHEEHVEPGQDRPAIFASHQLEPAHRHGAIQVTPRKYSPCTSSDQSTLTLSCSDRFASLSSQADIGVHQTMSALWPS